MKSSGAGPDSFHSSEAQAPQPDRNHGSTDPLESTNGAAENPLEVAKFKARIEALASKAVPPLIPGKMFDAAKYTLTSSVLLPADSVAVEEQPSLGIRRATVRAGTSPAPRIPRSGAGTPFLADPHLHRCPARQRAVLLVGLHPDWPYRPSG
ncbi:MAG TPA: hypothetical protein VMR54_02455 [Thermoanaerobaculia bacterium]|nr:hypothetical protein [Thermoanaerobaculia bacterium]HTQ09718.1 hypothetical protein [Fimbriimonadaceae bacterium]